MDEIKNLDVVALLIDLPEYHLRRGAVGTVVETFTANEAHPGGYVVEFVDETGGVYALADVTDASQLIPLRFKQEAA
jgi:hypothetical protein